MVRCTKAKAFEKPLSEGGCRVQGRGAPLVERTVASHTGIHYPVGRQGIQCCVYLCNKRQTARCDGVRGQAPTLLDMATALNALACWAESGRCPLSPQTPRNKAIQGRTSSMAVPSSEYRTYDFPVHRH